MDKISQVILERLVESGPELALLVIELGLQTAAGRPELTVVQRLILMNAHADFRRLQREEATADELDNPGSV